METATYIKTLDGFRGNAALYRLSKPLGGYSDDEKTFEFVVASASRIPYVGGTETYLFGADADGNVVDWCELPGSVKNTLDHADALRRAGYEIRAAA